MAFDVKKIEEFLNTGVVLDTGSYYKYKVAGGALVPNLIAPLEKCPIGRPPYHFFMPHDVTAEVFNTHGDGAEDKFNPIDMSMDRAYWSDVGIRIDAQFLMRDMMLVEDVLQVGVMQSTMIRMMDAMRRQLDHLCIQNLIGRMPATLRDVNVIKEFSEFNFGSIEGRYNRATKYEELPLTRYIPVNATYPYYEDGAESNTLQAEGLTVGKIMLGADALSSIPGQKILLVKQKYMNQLSVETNIINTNSTMSEKLNLNADITTYQSVGGVLVIGIPDAHFPNVTYNKAHWVNANNAGGAIDMLTTDGANEKVVDALDYGIMFIANGESLRIGEESPLYSPSSVSDNQYSAPQIGALDEAGLPTTIAPQTKWEGFGNMGLPGSKLKIRFEQIYWFSRPRENNIVVIELNPSLTRINEI